MNTTAGPGAEQKTIEGSHTGTGDSVQFHRDSSCDEIPESCFL